MATITTSIPFVDWPITDDGKTLFDTKNDALPPQLQALADDSATFVTEANALRDEVNGFQLSASASAVASANAQTAAEGFRDEAEGFRDDSQSILDSNTVIAAAVQASAGLPSLTGKAGFYLQVNVTEDGVEWTEIEIPPAGTNALPTYVNNTASGTVDLDFSLYSAFEITAVGDLTLNAINLPTDGARATAYLNAINFSYHTVTLSENISGSVTFNEFQTSATGANVKSVTAQTSNPFGFDFSNDGLTMMVVDGASVVYEYSLTSPRTPSTATYTGRSYNASGTITSAWSVRLSSDGLTMYLTDRDDENVHSFTLSTANNLTTVTPLSTADLSAQCSDLRAIDFNADESILFAVDNGTDAVYKYEMSTSGDLSTISFSGDSLDVSTETTTPLSLCYNNNVLVVGSTTSQFQYFMTSETLSSASFSASINTSGSYTSVYGSYINNSEGLFMIVEDSDQVVRWNNAINGAFNTSSIEFKQIGNTTIARNA